MSQSTAGNNKAAAECTKPQSFTTFCRPCAVIPGHLSGPIVGGASLGVSTEVETRIISSKSAGKDPWMGFTIEFPRGKDCEDEGFGMCHSLDSAQGMPGTSYFGVPVPAETLRITVKFPRGEIMSTFEKADDRNQLRKRFPNVPADKELVLVEVSCRTEVVVEGLGLPFSNPGHPSHAWLNNNEPIAEDMTLMNMLEQRNFCLVVAKTPLATLEKEWDDDKLPPPFRYPYNADQSWQGLYTYIDQLKEEKGPQFAPAWTHVDDDSHLAVTCQSQVQDVLWVEEAARNIRSTPLPAYFVDKPSKKAEMYYVIVQLPKTFTDKYAPAWSRLTKCDFFKLNLYKSFEEAESEMLKEKFEDELNRPNWDAKFVDCHDRGEFLKGHPVKADEFVLLVRRPAKHEHRRGPLYQNWIGLHFDAGLKEARRKVEAAWELRPGAKPSNPGVFGLAEGSKETFDPVNAASREKKVLWDMRIHRALLRGTGFHECLRAYARNPLDPLQAIAGLQFDGTQNKASFTRGTALSPPVKSLLPTSDEDYVTGLMEEAHPDDRLRFQRYLSARQLGLGLITAGPGFGKTTALAVAALGMIASIGPIYLTAPTNVAVNNAAVRLARIDSRVTERLNKGKMPDDPTFRHRRLIIRPWDAADEFTAFENLLHDPESLEQSTPRRGWRSSKWQLELSSAYWLLIVLRSPAVRELSSDDSPVLHQLRRIIDADAEMATLRSRATGQTSWQEYLDWKRGIPTHLVITTFFNIIQGAADALCTTPARSCGEFKEWKNNRAKGIVADEAGNMTRPDLYSVWGNTGIPCVLAGDDKQLPPIVLTMEEIDQTGNHLNRHGPDLKISPILFFKAIGWPVYRLRVQHRMAQGQFDFCHDKVYSDVPFTYGPRCQIQFPEHQIGRNLEVYLRARYPELQPAPAGQLCPFFVHCRGSYCFIDPVTKAKLNIDQIKIGLDLILDFVRLSGADPKDIAIISPYAANVKKITRLRKSDEYACLANMPRASTVDSFQGQEADIIFLILGSTQAVGPGFTSNENRLNVMLTRHKSGLVVVGDINVTGNVEILLRRAKQRAKKGKGTGKGKGKSMANNPDVMRVATNTGENAFVRVNMLRDLCLSSHELGRVIRIQVPEKDKSGKDGANAGK